METPEDILTRAGFNGSEFRYSDSNGRSMRGPCPKCGGTRRLLVFIDNPLPFWNYVCDLCGFKGRQLEGVPVEEVGMRIPGTRERPDYSVAIEALNASAEWIDYHLALKEENREWLRGRGIPDEYQNRWTLGYVERKPFLHGGKIYHSPAYSIPKVGHDLVLRNIDYRLTNPVEGAGKYRGETGLPPAVFIANPGHIELNRAFIVEGAFKAMVLFIYLQENGWSDTQVIGLPGISSPLWKEHIWEYAESFVMLDPDFPERTKAIARETGSRPVYLPVKVDDAILAGMSWSSFEAVIRNSDL
jgi:hypothetical protein